MATRKADYDYKLFRIKREDGKVTTVSVKDDEYIKFIIGFGGGVNGESAVSDFVRDAALRFRPELHGKNCSGYIRAELFKAIGLSVPA